MLALIVHLVQLLRESQKITSNNDNISKEINYGFNACDCDATIKLNDIDYSVVINN